MFISENEDGSEAGIWEIIETVRKAYLIYNINKGN
jgi:uncharacterized cupin superfamily protein